MKVGILTRGREGKRGTEGRREGERESERERERDRERERRRRLERKRNEGRKVWGKEKPWQFFGKPCSSSRKLRLPCAPLVPVFSTVGRWLSLVDRPIVQ